MGNGNNSNSGNERVSQLVELFASDLQFDDVILATDTSQKESKKVEIGQLLLYFENSGSYSAYSALTALTASYVAASNVNGTVAVALNSTRSISSSWSPYAISASNAVSASFTTYAQTSYISTSIANTASYLEYPNNSTASYAINSLLSSYTNTASYLQYINGFINGSSSYALTCSTAIISNNSLKANTSLSSSWATSSITSLSSSYSSYSVYSLSSSYSSCSVYSTSSSFASQSLTASYLIGFVGPTKAWAQIIWNSLEVNAPTIYNNYNIASFIYSNRFSSPDTTTYYDQFLVSFQTPLANSNYILVGTAYAGYSYIAPAYPILDPFHANRTTLGFTMSVATPSDVNWYGAVSGFYGQRIPQMSFQILG